MRYSSGGLSEITQKKNVDIFLTYLHKRGRGKFELMTSASLSVVLVD
jgi:hypothetical protein